jgi:hypothetical protein
MILTVQCYNPGNASERKDERMGNLLSSYKNDRYVIIK